VIQGHTHVFALEKDAQKNKRNRNSIKYNSQNKRIFLNPGSLSEPRTSFYTYAVVDCNGIDIINIKTATSLKSISTTRTSSIKRATKT